jgi:hypothetical protein
MFQTYLLEYPALLIRLELKISFASACGNGVHQGKFAIEDSGNV